MTIKPKLLLVDDDEVALNGLIKILTSDGYPVSGALSGNEALNLLSKENFDIIITDVNMPGIGGLLLISEIKKRGYSGVIIVVTASRYIRTIVDAINLGADHYLAKPLNVNELKFVLEKVWDSSWAIAQHRFEVL